MMIMKVMQKFKENVRINKIQRGEIPAETPLKGNVDFLRVSGNKHFIHGHDHEYNEPKNVTPTEQSQDEFVNGEGKVRVRRKLYKGSTLHQATPLSYNEAETHQENGHKSFKGLQIDYLDQNRETGFTLSRENSFEDDNKAVVNETFYESDEDEVDSAEYRSEAMDGDGPRTLSASQGPRMETIPEETEVDMEVDDISDANPRLTRRHLSFLNRSHSKRNIFDVNERVPLLPDVAGAHGSVINRPILQTFDKETQTSDKQLQPQRKKESHLRKKKKRPHRPSSPSTPSTPRRKLIIKLPGTVSRDDSAKSNSGNVGSESEDNLTDTDFAYGFESETWYDSSSESEYSSEEENDAILFERDKTISPGNYSLTLTKYKTALRRKQAHSKSQEQTFPSVTNITPDLPVANNLFVNPFSLKFKERSFFIKSSIKERPSHSARSEKRRHNTDSGFEDTASVTSTRSNADIANDLRSKQSDDLRRSSEREITKDNTQSTTLPSMYPEVNIAVFGRKADGHGRDVLPPPPNTPSHYQDPQTPRRKPRSHLNRVLLAQKTEREREQQRIHEMVTSDPVQKYERTKSGRIRPFGTARPAVHEVPSLKEQHFRDKLLKQERDSILKQNIKMKRFIDVFDKGHPGLRLERGQSVILPSSRPSPVVRRLDPHPSHPLHPTSQTGRRLAVSYLKFTNRSRTLQNQHGK
ncbi:uncharacterized protein LOC128228024 isoform X2 [Mya arenaria]|uniref:uncharacterized protein LOC128228024 isoform X2 n=1 Tax=Mya arenaria TaxID=6604 RepID=UPI0022E31B1F|nr:uncharacterized protein LOC128228024 isoform X2 [Mya arenaria]